MNTKFIPLVVLVAGLMACGLFAQDAPYRIIYFIGHKDHKKSALITQIYDDYQTFSKLWQGESATRTLLNLYNLHAVRGNIDDNGSLIFKTSMSGPHHYFGYLDPFKAYTMTFLDGIPRFTPHDNASTCGMREQEKFDLPDEYILEITDYDWLTGSRMSSEMRARYAFPVDQQPTEHFDTQTGEADSIFDVPGILALGDKKLVFNIVRDVIRYDLSPFRAQLVCNTEPFAFNQELIAKFKHAQHRLRLLTYNYGDQYVEDYLMQGSGIFIEHHEFVQSITPMNHQCGGFVIIGREVIDEANRKLELVAVTVPYGYTLLIDVGSIHSDSTLTGLHLMAMTGNHKAMATADTVFMKHRATRRNVAIKTIPELDDVPGLTGASFFLTSNEKSLSDLRYDDEKLKKAIKKEVGWFKSLWWQPVILSGTSTISWPKTLGTSLPKV